MQYLENYKLIKSMYEDKFFNSLNYIQKRKVIEALYIDPDKYDKDLLKNFSNITEKFKDIEFSPDGLCGWKLLYDVFDGKKIWLEKYKIIRQSRFGEFIWPSIFNAGQTINQEKSAVLGDRIDLTIFDIKRYINRLKTKMTFDNTYTKVFLDYYRKEGFETFCNDYKLINVFVNNSNFAVENCVCILKIQ